MLRVAVDLGGRARVVCSVARTAVEQSRGLQGHPGLRDAEGMLFPFYPPRAATFHMGEVAFPIDLVFADGAGVVARIVHGARPGSRAQWTHPVVGAVVELRAGSALSMGLEVGDQLRVAGRRLGTQTYNLLRTLTEAGASSSLDDPRGPSDDGFNVRGDPPPLMDGYYSKEPLHQGPGFGGVPTTQPSDRRFKDRELVDESSPDAMDQGNPNWEEGVGYVRPLSDDPVYPIRPSASKTVDEVLGDFSRNAPTRPIGPLAVHFRLRSLIEEARRTAQQFEVQLGEFVPGMVEAAARAGLPYEPLALNEHRQQAVITPKEVGAWLHELGLPERDRDALFSVATSETGLDRIGAGLIAAQLADTANITRYGAQPVLVLTQNQGNKKESSWT